MKKYVDLVDLVKSSPKSIQIFSSYLDVFSVYLQKSASIQPRTSLSKFGGKFNSVFIRLLLRKCARGLPTFHVLSQLTKFCVQEESVLHVEHPLVLGLAERNNSGNFVRENFCDVKNLLQSRKNRADQFLGKKEHQAGRILEANGTR